MKLIMVRFVVVLVLTFLVAAAAGTEIDARSSSSNHHNSRLNRSVRSRHIKRRYLPCSIEIPEALASALQPLQSGQPQTSMVANRQMKTITVRDYPENIAAIGEALKRLDVPDAVSKPRTPSSIEFQLHLIAASPTAAEKTAFPTALEPVVSQLKSTLKFANYRYLTTFSNRVNENGTIDSQGVISPPFPIAAHAQLKSGYSYQIRNPQVTLDAGGKEVILTQSFTFKIEVPVETGGAAINSVTCDYQLN